MMRFTRTFQFFLNLTALWAFSALVSTGQMHLPAVVVALPLMILPMLGVARRLQLPAAFWTFLTVLAFLAGFLNMLFMREMMYSLVYFFLFLEIAKLWTVAQNRDVFQILILSFFQMVAASVMTASISFATMFLGYMFLVTVTWMLFSIKREADDVASGKWRPRAKRHKKTTRLSPIPIAAGAEDGTREIDRARVMNWGFLYGSVWLTLVLMVGTAGIFMLIPRLSSQRFLSGFQMMRTQRVSGISEQVDFDNIGNIQLDPTVIARVRTVARRGDAAASPPPYLRLRASSLDNYTGRQWRKGRQAYSAQVPYSAIMDFTNRESAPNGDYLRQDIILEPDGSNYFFGATMPVRYMFSRPFAISFDPYNFSVMALQPRDTSIRYTVDSVVPKEIDRELVPLAPPKAPSLIDKIGDRARLVLHAGREAAREYSRDIATPSSPRRSFGGMTDAMTGEGRRFEPRTTERRRFVERRGDTQDPGRYQEYRGRRALFRIQNAVDRVFSAGRSAAASTGQRLPGELQQIFTELPDLPDMVAVRQLAREWTQADAADLAKATRIEHMLQTRFTYTTDIEVADPELHMTEFLTKTRSGHCEYFASAMALMLRSLDIPARIVTGYFSDEFNEAGGYFMIRRQHAHSWVESWIEPHGWVTFDPTPASGVGTGRFHTGGILAGLQTYLDAVRYHWYRHVIDFDLQDQFHIAFSASRWSGRLSGKLDDVFKPLRQLTDGLSLRARGLSPMRMVLLGLCAILGAAIGGLLVREAFGALSRRRGGKQSPRAAAIHRQVAYYTEILQTLAALRYRKKSGQTPWEFAGEVVASRDDWRDLLPVTEAYYHARFRSGEITPEDLDRARGLIETLRAGKRE